MTLFEKVYALVDSGADISLISRETLDKTAAKNKFEFSTKDCVPLQTSNLNKAELGLWGFNPHSQLPIHFRGESHMEPFQFYQLNQTFALNDVMGLFSSVLSDNNVSLHHVIQSLSPTQNYQVSVIRSHLHTHSQLTIK